MRRSLAALLLCTALPPYRPTALAAQQPGVDIQSYHFRVDLPDTGNVIKGWASILFDTGRGWDDTLRLDLVGMTVDKVVGMTTLLPLPYVYDGRVLKIVQPRAQGVMVEYHGAPSDGLIIRANARGRRSFFGDNWPNRARFWLPTIDHPSDKARVLWSVRAPRGMRVVTNAPQCAPTLPRSHAPTRCSESAPIPTYTMVLGATQMTVSRHRPAIVGRDTIPIEVWAYPEDSAFADSVPFRRATEMVEAMARIVGPFPYSKLAHVQSSTRYGGMENSTAIFYSEQSYVRRSMREGVVRHETAHQWFGDAVTEADWHHAWLSEGFATYFDLVIGAALDGDTLLARGLRGNAEGYLRSRDVERPIVDTTVADPNRMLNANSYQKGGWVLHMLRQALGDSAFFRGVRDYYRIYRDSSVLSAHFQQRMEAASRADLGWFFQQWLRQPGYPQVEARISTEAGGGGRVMVRLQQVQPAAWGAFRIDRLPVAIEGCETRTNLDLAATFDEQTFTVAVPPGCVATSARVDPDGSWLIRQN